MMVPANRGGNNNIPANNSHLEEQKQSSDHEMIDASQAPGFKPPYTDPKIDVGNMDDFMDPAER